MDPTWPKKDHIDIHYTKDVLDVIWDIWACVEIEGPPPSKWAVSLLLFP